MRDLLLALLFAALTFEAAHGQSRSIRDYTHQRWSTAGETPAPVSALAQDGSGFLWLATGEGLFRFDGIRFDRISSSADAARHGAPSALLVRRNGEVWTSFDRSLRFAVYRNGELIWLAAPAPARVVKMAEDLDGSVWVMTDHIEAPILRWHEGRWTRFAAPDTLPDNAVGMVVAADRALWVSFGRSIARLAPGDDRLRILRRTPRGLGALSLDREGRVWVSERRGSYPVTGPGGRGEPPPLRHAYATDGAQVRGQPMFDRSGNLWIATYYGGIERVALPDPRGAASAAEARRAVEQFTSGDGLSSNSTTQLLQDWEGNVWASSQKGIDRFWPATIRSYAELDAPAAFGDLLMRASDGSIYIGQSATLYRAGRGERPQPILRNGREPSTLCEAPDGAVWVTFDTLVVRWKNGRASRPIPAVPTNATLYDCAFDRQGDYWISAARGGLMRYRGGRWERLGGTHGPQFLPRSMMVDSAGRLALHWQPGMLSWIDGGARTSLRLPFALHRNDEIALQSGRNGALYAAAPLGMAQIRDGRATLAPPGATIFIGVNGMVQTATGQTWLATPSGLVLLQTLAFDRAFDRPSKMPSSQLFGAPDGLLSPPHRHSRHALVEGGDGRIWVSSQSGTLWLDPKDIGRSGSPPRVAIAALIADRTYRDPRQLHLPAGTRNIEIDFAAMNFFSPREVQVRYRLEGQDSDWVEAGLRRQAFFTNLSPGAYRFRVIAANQDGIWNHKGATVSFEIPPTFVQSRWILLIIGIGVLLLCWAAIALRTRQIARRLRLRMNERLDERERIARDLHDTLLQGAQGLILSFQALAERIAPSERPRLEAVLKRADAVVIEARERVLALRQPTNDGDLPALLRALAEESMLAPATEVTLVVEGEPRPLRPDAAAEIAAVVSEALFNVARHAMARRTEMVAIVTRRRLTIHIRDDGAGISPDILDRGGKPGHFGLAGMRERVERLSGRLTVRSNIGTGTSVTLDLPGRIAFRRTTRFSISRWLERLRG